MNKYVVPVDLIFKCNSPTEAKILADNFMIWAAKQGSEKFSLSSFYYPVGYPVEEM